jgi:hypothetical protein
VIDRASRGLALGLALASIAVAAAAPTSLAAPTSQAAPLSPAAIDPTVPLPEEPDGAVGALQEASVLDVQTRTSVAEVTLGEPFRYTIDVLHPAPDAYGPPADLARALAAKGFELRGEPSTERTPAARGARTRLELQLAVVSTLEPRIPELHLLVQGPAGPRQLTVTGRGIALRRLATGEAAEGHRGPKPPETVWVASFLWAKLLVALLLAWLAVHEVRRALRRRAARAAEPPPPPTAEEEALRRLAGLRARAPWRTGGGRAAVFELSEIVRGYLGKRTGLPCVELTSGELLTALAKRPQQGLVLADFSAALEWEDLVKFARHEPSPEECAEAVEQAGRLVERTRPQATPHAMPEPPR